MARRTGIEETERRIQPWNVWVRGDIVYFAYTEGEAIAHLEAAIAKSLLITKIKEKKAEQGVGADGR